MKTSAVILYLGLLFTTNSSLAFDVGLGVLQPADKTQDASGKDIPDPISPTISIGHTWDIYGFMFAPRFGFIKQTDNTDDNYGGGSTIETFYLLYDFLMPLGHLSSFKLRYGFGTFRKTVKGGGGTVTIPNGEPPQTMTAYKPETSKPSSTLSANLGVDYNFGFMGQTIKDQGVRGELFILQPLDKDKRLFSLMFSYALFF
jgi:hypothetical protein